MIGLFRKTFNLSGCEIAIDPDRSIYHQGDYIKCKISINGSSVYEQTADEITLILEESWRTSDGESSTTHRHDRVTRVVDNNVVLKPGSTFNFIPMLDLLYNINSVIVKYFCNLIYN